MTISGVKISGFDKLASNGVIHLVDDVIFPPSMDLVELAKANSQFSTILSAVQTAGLEHTLKGLPFHIQFDLQSIVKILNAFDSVVQLVKAKRAGK